MTAFSIQTTAEDHRIAWFTALAITIHIIESALPSPLPGLKPGLANVVTITVLILYGWKAAAWVSILRVIAGSLILGTFLSPTFLLSFSGALCAILALFIADALPGKGFGPMGFSLLAALAHMTGQVSMAYIAFVPHPGIWQLFPVLIGFAVLLGASNGLISLFVLKRLT